jgi:hypothetical protein
MSTAAFADRGWRDSPRGYDYRGHDHRGGGYRRHDAPVYQHHYGQRRKKDRVGAAVAVGIGALILGIIASEAARRDRGHHYYD